MLVESLSISPKGIYDVQRRGLKRPILSRFSNKSLPFPLSSHDERKSDFLSSDDDEDQHNRRALIVLLTVPIAWGTFEPAVRLVYALENPMPGFLFGASYYLVATASLGAASALVVNNDNTSSAKEPNKWGGIELGTYLFVGNALQVLGLQTITSDRAAFLLQLTTIFVPVVDATMNRSTVSLRSWFACCMALVGIAVLTFDGDNESLSIGLTRGDGFVILAAFCYTFHCIRLQIYARRTAVLSLAYQKALVEFGWSVLVVALLSFSPPDSPRFVQEQRETIQNFVRWLSEGLYEGNAGVMTGLTTIIAASTWTGLVSVAYTIAAQSYGQRHVKPVTANLIYTLQPVATAVVAWLLLHESLPSPINYTGAALLGVAVVVVGTEDS